MATQDFVDFYFHEYIFGFMYNDIRRAIEDARANFLVALGLSVYTEIMGGFVTGHLKDTRWAKKNYKAFLPYLGSYYVNLDKQIDLYSRVRCGLVHEYFVKGGPAMIAVKFDNEKLPGIIYTPKYDHIHIALAHYFKDFKYGAQKYYELLKSGDVDLLRKFKQAIS